MASASKLRFADALKDYSEKYLPDGKIELIEGDEIREHPLLSGLPHQSSSNALHFTQQDKHHLFRRITPELYLHLIAGLSSYNYGILKNISKHIAEEIRNKAITTSN